MNKMERFGWIGIGVLLTLIIEFVLGWATLGHLPA